MAKRAAKRGVAVEMVAGAMSAHATAARIDSLASQVRAAEDAMNAAVARMGALLRAGKVEEAAEVEREADGLFATYDALSARLVSEGEAFVQAAA